MIYTFFDGYRGQLCSAANDPQTANDPQIVPQRIPGPELIPLQKLVM